MTDWDGILSREGPAVWRTVYRLLGRRADAEDCFQETFLAALQAWRDEAEAGRAVQSPRALLHRLATARAIDRLRSRYRQGGGSGTSILTAGLTLCRGHTAARKSTRLPPSSPRRCGRRWPPSRSARRKSSASTASTAGATTKSPATPA